MKRTLGYMCGPSGWVCSALKYHMGAEMLVWKSGGGDGMDLLMNGFGSTSKIVGTREDIMVDGSKISSYARECTFMLPYTEI